MRSATYLSAHESIESLVSIHALLAECDSGTFSLSPIWERFNPRTPCGVRRLPPACGFRFCCFNPRTPCGVRHKVTYFPRRGNLFQSTHSLRSATKVDALLIFTDSVSIHALLAECDSHGFHGCREATGFNPRTPCGVRPSSVGTLIASTRFQSTHSLRSATRYLLTALRHDLFQSTHSLRSATVIFHIFPFMI